MKKIIKNIILGTLVVFATSSCSKWLDVHPKSQITEDDQFSNENGYAEALNGVYLKMSDQGHYGSYSTFNYLDILSQYYEFNASDSRFPLTQYDYSTSEGQAVSNSIWKATYSEIANINNLIIHLNEVDKKMFDGDNYNLIKGEALALRALLHFDIYRLYAPNIKLDNTTRLPYVTTVGVEPTEGIIQSEFLNKVMDDLNEASKLLVDVDPIVGNAGAKYDDMERTSRVNYYAVQAMLAKVYANKGEKDLAYTAAKSIIDASNVFSFATDDEINAGDLLFSNEIIFGVHNQLLNSIQETYFSNSQLNLGIEESHYNAIFESESTDRRANNLFSTINVSSINYFVLNKYKDMESLAEYQSMVPIIRLGEMYLIAAENAPTATESLSLLNVLRIARGILEVSDETLIADYIKSEYKKEMIGDGQLFYYYKKNNIIPELGNVPVADFDESKFVLPIPDLEVELGNL